ncbi:hypothetical protein F2K45_24530 [Salmonella enterica subsp. enterica]|nr:hypothetical protein [Salmonella enterica subsp. enterica serovar Heidelberg]
MNLKEDIFADLYHAGALGSVCVEMRPGHAVVSYKLVADGSKGYVHTKRGEVKQYRAETALRTLYFIGLRGVQVDFSGWD